MTTLQLLQTLEQLQHESFKYYIELVDISDEYEYQIVIPCTKEQGAYITLVLNEDYEIGVTTEFIVDHLIIDTGITIKE